MSVQPRVGNDQCRAIQNAPDSALDDLNDFLWEQFPATRGNKELQKLVQKVADGDKELYVKLDAYLKMNSLDGRPERQQLREELRKLINP